MCRVLLRETSFTTPLHSPTTTKVKGKSVPFQAQSAQRVPGSLGSQITWQWSRMVVRLSALRTGRLYPQKIFLVLISVRGWVDPRAIVRSEGLCQWKIPMTPSGIEPATSWFEAQHLNHCSRGEGLMSPTEGFLHNHISSRMSVTVQNFEWWSPD